MILFERILHLERPRERHVVVSNQQIFISIPPLASPFSTGHIWAEPTAGEVRKGCPAIRSLGRARYSRVQLVCTLVSFMQASEPIEGQYFTIRRFYWLAYRNCADKGANFLHPTVYAGMV
jgi:hypothetical protein